MTNSINIVLVHPEIPPNTGNVARLCVCNNLVLHLIHPLGFSLDEKKVQRAGLDYWKHLNLKEHKSWESFEESLPQNAGLYFFSAKADKSFWEVEYPDNSYLIFGSETYGLPQPIREKYSQSLVTLPMYGENSRCLNLSGSVTAAAYEVLRQRELG